MSATDRLELEGGKTIQWQHANEKENIFFTLLQINSRAHCLNFFSTIGSLINGAVYNDA